jgi:hypothetical protein
MTIVREWRNKDNAAPLHCRWHHGHQHQKLEELTSSASSGDAMELCRVRFSSLNGRLRTVGPYAVGPLSVRTACARGRRGGRPTVPSSGRPNVRPGTARYLPQAYVRIEEGTCTKWTVPNRVDTDGRTVRYYVRHTVQLYEVTVRCPLPSERSRLFDPYNYGPQ